MGLGKSPKEPRLAGLQMEEPEGRSRRKAWGSPGHQTVLVSRREQTSDRRDERQRQVPTGNMSLSVDQTPRWLVTLQKVVGHKGEGGREERSEVVLLFCRQKKPGEPCFLFAGEPANPYVGVHLLGFKDYGVIGH